MKKGVNIGIAVTFLLGVLLCIAFGIDSYIKRIQSVDIIGGANANAGKCSPKMIDENVFADYEKITCKGGRFSPPPFSWSLFK